MSAKRKINMGFFQKETIILKESNAYKDYLSKLEKLFETAPPSLKYELEKEIRITKAGIEGEDNILYELKNSGMDLVVLHDLYIESGDQSAQIDFMIITNILNFIIECKNLVGNITINKNGDFIRSFYVGGKQIREGFYSPITQNSRHIEVLKNKKYEESGLIAKASVKMYFEDFNKSLVVLANPKTILNDRYAKKEIKDQVVRADQLAAKMRELNEKSNEDRVNMNKMLEAGRIWLERGSEHDGFEDRYQGFLKRVEVTKQMEQESEGTMICPKCGGTLVLRTAKKGPFAGQQFYGCSNYASKGCKFTLNVNAR